MSTLSKPVNSPDAFSSDASIFGAAGGSEGERSEPERTPAAPKILPAPPDPEVVVRPVRRQFTAAYKQRILAEIEAAAGTGEIGRILRREGLYTSQPTKWRQARDRAAQLALAPQPRGPKRAAVNPLRAENLQLQREKKKLEKKLHTAELMLELQKKVSELLGITLPLMQSDNDEENS
jgi:transposase-like protein